MKLPSKLVLLHLLFFTVFPAAADDTTNLYNQQQTSNNTQKIVEYLQNLGSYLGFDVTSLPTQNNPDYSMSYKLINLTTSQLAQAYQFYTFLGSIPVNTFAATNSGGNTGNTSNPYAQFIPNAIFEYASTLNDLANNVFPNYNSASTTSEHVSANALLDQQTYQDDPVSQAVLNILGTPDYTYCMNYDSAQTYTAGCTYLYETLVSANVVGTIPDAKTFFNSTYIQQFLNQLNSNALTGPLMYSTDALPMPQTNNQGIPPNDGLNAQNQEQLAANFIRYVTGGVVPIKLPKWKEYDTLYSQAISNPNNSNTPSTTQMQAQQTLARYLASLRSYAAQNSVGISNLYYIMSKRMPQTAPKQKTGQMSQSLSEYNMATWRLYNPATGSTSGTGGTAGTGQPGNTPWINSLNNAPPATVEKEIAVLLAEINYQLYLDRQIHERLLMTNSILLLQSVRTGAPDFTAGQQP